MKERHKFHIKVQRTKETVVEIHAEEKEIAIDVVKKLVAANPEGFAWGTTTIDAKVLDDGENDV